MTDDALAGAAGAVAGPLVVLLVCVVLTGQVDWHIVAAGIAGGCVAALISWSMPDPIQLDLRRLERLVREPGNVVPLRRPDRPLSY